MFMVGFSSSFSFGAFGSVGSLRGHPLPQNLAIALLRRALCILRCPIYHPITGEQNNTIMSNNNKKASSSSRSTAMTGRTLFVNYDIIFKKGIIIIY